MLSGRGRPRLAGDDPGATWEDYGARDPYFGVLADPRFHAAALTAERKAEFFSTGERHVDALLATVRRHLDAEFRPARGLDFGCGVGRVTLPLARVCARVTGVDVSASMLGEAAANASQWGIGNVEWLRGDGGPPNATGRFDLVHSYIVLQHQSPRHGLDLFVGLLDRVADGGIAALQILYARNESPARALLYAARRQVPGFNRVVERLRGRTGRRLMQMNPTPLAPAFAALQQGGFGQVHVEFSDHGTARTAVPGVFLFARKAAGAAW